MHSILVVDTSSQACSFVSACLHTLRHTTFAATSITEASNLMRLAPPDLLILNLAMPGAIAFLSTVRQAPESADLPIVALSDPVAPATWQEAASLGIRHFLPKDRPPIAQLQSCVADCLRQTAQSPQLRRGAA